MRILIRRHVGPFMTAQCLAILMACLVLTGFGPCKLTPAQQDSQLTKAAKASKSLAQYTGDAISLVKTLYESGAIKLDLKNKLADELETFSKGGHAFNDLLATLSQQFKDGVLPASQWAIVVAQFNQLTKVFVTLLDLVPQAAGLASSKAWAIITATIVAIAQTFVMAGFSVPAWPDIQHRLPDWRQLPESAEFRAEVLQ